MLIASLIIFGLYFAMLFLATQRFYFLKYSYLFVMLLLSLMASVLSFIYIKYGKNDVKVPYVVLLFPFYLLLVIAVKSCYKKFNTWLIKKKLVKNEFADKEFTYLFFTVSGTGFWNKKLVSKPSWFDYVINFVLLAVPLMMVGIAISMFGN